MALQGAINISIPVVDRFLPQWKIIIAPQHEDIVELKENVRQSILHNLSAGASCLFCLIRPTSHLIDAQDDQVS